uniref:Shikimate O-hydroxycinnamoyltransferase n=1 Tax=Opuntia streptacantha TaxID=393608 RepID=A0A7C9EDM1_OPUST
MEQNQKNTTSPSVKVHSVLTIVSGTPVRKGSVCPLSPLDHAMAHHSLHLIFYYSCGSFDLDRIRPPLNDVLSLYPIVTGRLARDGDGNWHVKCTDAGVRTYLANADVSIDEWLRFAGADDERLLSPWEDLPDDPHIWSPFRIQITEFEGGGTAVGLSCPHMLADPTSATLLIKSWTEALHHEPIAHPPLLHPLALKPPPATTTSITSPVYYAAKSTRSEPKKSPKMASATFCFLDSAIKKSLSEIQSTFPDATPFDLLVALFWTRIARVKRSTWDQTPSMSFCMDIRRRLQDPLPDGFFGNALHFSQLKVGAHELECGDLCNVAELVHCHVAGLDLQDEFWSAVDWLGSRKDGHGKFASPFRMYGPELTCVNMEHMIPDESESEPFMYMTQFVKGQKPVHVSCHVGNSEGEGLILVLPSPEGGLARRVAVMLPEEEMDRLVEDKVILSLEPTFLLSGRM